MDMNRRHMLMQLVAATAVLGSVPAWATTENPGAAVRPHFDLPHTGLNYYYPSPGFTGHLEVSWLHRGNYRVVGTSSPYARFAPRQLFESDLLWVADQKLCGFLRVWIPVDAH